MSSPSTTIESLPKQFVQAMRTLFDILDDKKTGLVALQDIENRWQDESTKGVIESLQKVTPPNGKLTFERFCAGLKICLLRNQTESKIEKERPPSAPLLDLDQPKNWNTATVRPNVISTQRTLSMPQLIPKNEPKVLFGPPKPPRVNLENKTNLDRAEIRTALQNWQIGILMNEEKGGFRSAGDGKPDNALYQKKNSAKRREPRRHTLQNGIDYNMLKRMKQIEQEKDVLMQGLQAVERTRDWYLKQVAAVQEKMKYLGKMGTHTVSKYFIMAYILLIF